MRTFLLSVERGGRLKTRETRFSIENLLLIELNLNQLSVGTFLDVNGPVVRKKAGGTRIRLGEVRERFR